MASIVSTARAIDRGKTNIRFDFLVILAVLFIDVFTPFPIWKGFIPSSVRWLSHISIIFAIGLTISRMLLFNYFPRVTLLVLGSSLLWSAVAIAKGQGISATIWGWWIMFQFPLLGLYAYMLPHWPASIVRWLRISCIVFLVLNVIVQLGQYFTGEIPGDNLAGLFGKNGTGNLIVFNVLVVGMALGNWLTTRHWRSLLVSLPLGILSSVLGEMKLFIIASCLLIGVAFLIYILRGIGIWKIIPYLSILVVIAISFLVLYNTVVPGASEHPLEGYITDSSNVDDYLNFTKVDASGGHLVVGRNVALRYGWEVIQSDPVTFLLGYGLGARGESSSLGIVGIGLKQGTWGNESGTSILVIMQETGILGLLTLFGFLACICVMLIKAIRNSPHSEAQELRYALLMFTIFWPLWLWYSASWTLRVPMLLYWTAVGFALSEAIGFPSVSKEQFYK